MKACATEKAITEQSVIGNINAVRHLTRELIFNRPITRIFGDELDDFHEQTIDSTAVKASSCWPTDSKILTGLLTRGDQFAGHYLIVMTEPEAAALSSADAAIA